MAVPPEFSVVMPTRGDSAHLRAALRSALGAASAIAGGVEILLVHDRRPGNPALGAELLADPRVRGLEAPPGPAAARNVGIDAAAGRLIALLDDDDLWLGEHLVRAREVLGRRPDAVLVAGDAYLFEDRSAEGGATAPDDPSALPRFDPGVRGESIELAQLLDRNRILTPTVVLVRDRLEATDRFSTDLRVMEDWDLWLRLAHGRELAFDPRPSVIVRRRRGSASRHLRAMAEEALEVLARAERRGFPPRMLSPGWVRARRGRLWHELAYGCLAEDDLPAARRALRESMARLPLNLKNYIYFLAGCVPRGLRRRWFARAQLPAGSGLDGPRAPSRRERSATLP